MAQRDVTNKFPVNSPTDSEYAQKNEIHTSSFADSESAQKDGNVISPKASKDKVMNNEVVSAPGTNACGVTLAEGMLEDTENPIRKSSNEHEIEQEIGNITPSREESTWGKVAILGDSAPSGKKELGEFSSAKLLTNNKNDHMTPNNKTVRDLGIKRRSTPRSLHRSINFDTLARETAKASSPRPVKIINSRIMSKHSNDSKESTVPQISTRVSTNSMVKHPVIIPRPENKSYSRSSNTHESKAQPSTVSSCFVLKSEERAAKRKEFFQKLEDKKKKTHEMEKPQLQAKTKKPKIDFRDLRHSVAFKVPPNGKVSHKMESPDSLVKKEKLKIDSGYLRHSIASNSPNGKLSYKSESPNNFLKKIPHIYHCDSRIRGKTESKVQVQDRSSRPTWSFSTKTDGSTKPKDITGKNNRPPIYSAKSFPKKRLHENVSPNVQP